ncbi:hypothetical protein SLEP1_g30732 [Rubroshorea leprosula]|uniref:Retrotransposon gag domain-containing protein n=1 Tax=Rubroshorea leprosula TaxID=152421 RepID=A0AAV5K132_9ROSI|nr:hypothetical protein SLEP1_g30732 [Rubroshorea leprosula]
MSEENTATNPKKSAVDERVDKLEATMQTMAATIQTVSLTLYTLTTGSVPSPASLVPTTSTPPVIIPSSTITLGNHAKDPMVTQLQFPPIYENQPLMGESSSHDPQISSLPSEASYPPLKMNNPTLPTTIPLTLNIPPLIGQVPAIQPNPSIEILSPTLEDGKSREVDHKLQQLEETLKAMQGPQDVLMPMMYARKMAPYANDERVLVHYFQDSLSGPESVWFLMVDKKNICSFKDVSQAFMRQYEYNINLAPTRDSLQRITKKSNETFKEFAQWWRSEAAKVIPPLTDSEIYSLFIKSTTGTFRAWSRQFTKLSIPYSEALKQLVAVGLLETMQANPIQPPYPYWYDLQARCEYHNAVGHGTEYCATLKIKIQDLIDEGKLQFDVNEAKSTSNITRNPLPPHNAGTMNMVTLDEVEKLVLENASFWSLDELFVILTKYDLIQPIEQMSLNVPPAMIDDALVCPYHSNMKGHTLQDCEDFQKKVKELQVMRSLKFVSAQVSEKCIAQFEEVVVEDITDEIYSDHEEDSFASTTYLGRPT